MMISTKGRYALRVMLDLAMQPQGEYISLKAICDRQEVSMKYLEAIVSLLHKAEMIDSLRGKNGGYRLSKKPEEYTVYSILDLTESTLAPVSCLECNSECNRSDICLTRPMWIELDNIVAAFLKNKTLSDLLETGTNNEGAEL